MTIREAFLRVCDSATVVESGVYICLTSNVRAYGGPEEGGWWYDIDELVAYQWVASKDLAEKMISKIEALAQQLTAEARAAHGQHCLESMEWLEQRGLEADYLPEPDGPEEYKVSIFDTLPVFDNSTPQWC